MKKIIFIISLMLAGAYAFGITWIGGPHIITDQETWTLANSPYHVLGEVIIEEDYPGGTTVCDAELVIEPGVVIYFYEYHTPTSSLESFLNVKDGKLTAIGTASNRIKFTQVSGGGYEEWGGIIFNGTQGDQKSQIKYCTIEYAKKDPSGCGSGTATEDGGAIFIKNFDFLEIENNIIHNCDATGSRGGAIFIGASGAFSSSAPSNYPKITNNEIRNCVAQAGGAIALFGEHVHPSIIGNNIHDNTATIGGGGIAALLKSNAIIDKNTITSNTAQCISGSSSISVKGGGGILVNQGASVTIYKNTISNNTVTIDPNPTSTYPGAGGGILVCIGSEASISENTVSGNIAALYGGGIAVFGENGYMVSGSSTYDIQNNAIRGNRSKDGAGMYFQDSQGEASKNSIEENQAENEGGGIGFKNATGLFEWNTFTSNSAVAGSAVHFYNNIYLFGQFSQNLEFKHNTMTYNSAGEVGTFYAKSDHNGALYRIDLVNNLIHSNTSGGHAAGVYFYNYLNNLLTNNTICSNTSESRRGNAIYVEDGNYSACVYAENNILYYNGAAGDCQIYNPHWDPFSDYDNNCIQNLGCQIDPGTNNDFIPDFVDVANDDYHLNPTSPLIDIGDNTVSPIGQEDLDNAPRFQGTIDLGVYEQGGKEKRKSDIELSVEVYPNPANNVLYIASTSNDATAQIKVYTLDGKLIVSQSGLEAGDNALDINNLPIGVYMLHLTTKEATEMHKIVKQ